MSGTKVGKKCPIGRNVNIGGKAVIGNGVKIQNNVSLYDDVIIEDDVFCVLSCVFTNVINPRSFIERKHEYKQIKYNHKTCIIIECDIYYLLKLKDN
ncbi:hypothetical protein [Treponema denticola]|uniref:hypothetical protein n=1 Tax=Treponema denticola TaxID=158 RepID=UPI00351D1289